MAGSRAGSRPVVVTGWGVASPLGSHRESFARSLMAGMSAGRIIRAFDASAFPCKLAAEVAPFCLDERCAGWDLRGLDTSGDRKLELGLIAAHDALSQAGLLGSTRLDRISLGTGLSSVIPAELEIELMPFLSPEGEFDHRGFAAGALWQRGTVARHRPGRAAELLAGLLRCPGPCVSHFSACAASSHAIGQAARWVARGEADRVLAGGMDSMIHPLGLASFILLGTLTTRNNAPQRASRPFDRDRDGFLIGEGAAMLVLESLGSARARGVPPLARVLGFGSSVDAHQVTAPHPEGRGAALAMARALQSAGLDPVRVDYVNAHGTATLLNDPVEIAAFRRVFGDHAPRCPISSTKSMHGHLIAAAGAIEACAVLVALREQRIPPTINLEQLDPACQADVVPNQSRAAELRVALSNSFGFGGQNGCLVLGRYRG